MEWEVSFQVVFEGQDGYGPVLFTRMEGSDADVGGNKAKVLRALPGTAREVAKAIGIREKEVYEFLRDLGIIDCDLRSKIGVGEDRA